MALLIIMMIVLMIMKKNNKFWSGWFGMAHQSDRPALSLGRLGMDAERCAVVVGHFAVVEKRALANSWSIIASK